MRILYVDDDPLAVKLFEIAAKELADITKLNTFLSPAKALCFAKENPVDAAFLDVEMPEMTGLELARRLRAVHPSTRVFFVTAHDQYALEAFGVDAMGYLLKPYSREQLAAEMDKARRMRGAPQKTVYIQTIPSFDVYIDGELLPITSPKPKELLALMVDRGGSPVSTGQAISILWEDRLSDERTKALYRMTFKRLRELLKAAGIDFILSAEGTQKFIRPETFTCDYDRLLKGDEEALSKFSGEYMTEYSWAEETNARLSGMKERAKARSLR